MLHSLLALGLLGPLALVEGVQTIMPKSKSAQMPPRYYPLPPPSNISKAIANNHTSKRGQTPYPIYGVNLGGWLLLEPWITPSLFDAVDDDGVIDEYTYCQHLGADVCSQRLEEHWSTFFTQADIAALRAGGINTVRIPVGYWMFGDIEEGEPWVTGSLEHLQRMIEWCAAEDMKVLIDLHGGPGSQNGFDNSGQAGPMNWDNTYNIGRTIEVLRVLGDYFMEDTTRPHYDTVVGIGILNEPRWDININVVKQFYTDTYAAIKNNDIAFDFHISDAFRFGEWQGFMQFPDYEDVYLDTHLYHVFDGYFLGMSEQAHIDHACGVKNELANSPLWTVVGEWSLATTDCAKYLNGFVRPSQSRWQGEIDDYPVYGSCAGRDDVDDPDVWTPEYYQFLYNFAGAQQDAYTGSRGWFFWTAKNEEAPQWNYLLGLEKGYIPVIPEGTLPDYCSSL